jgi:hypothetical protein
MRAALNFLIKLKAVFLIVFLLFVTRGHLVAQKIENDSTSLLTSVIWKAGKNTEALYKFNADGTFFCTVTFSLPDGVIINDTMGKWEWIKHDTFTMQTTQSAINGQFKDLNPEPYHKRVIRILKIDDRILQGITYNILVNEDSEYAARFDWYVKH